MDKQQLQEILRNLHAELAAADKVDDESRILLQQLATDVEKKADQSAQQADDDHSLVEQLENAALRFESEHPKLSQALGDVMDALGKLGI